MENLNNTIEMNTEVNPIELEKIPTENLTEHLNDLLSNYQIFYMNVRGFHWNITGTKFFELHVKFEELYNDLNMKIDEIAERVLTLGGAPTHAFSDYIKISDIKEQKHVKDAAGTVKSLLDSFQTLIAKQRTILELSGEANDEGTNALMSDYIREQEKLIWMYRAFMK